MQFGVCIEMAFNDLPLEARMEMAARAGFRQVEIWLVDGTYKGGPEDLASEAEARGVSITNTVIGTPDGSTGGGLTNPARREEWLKRSELTIDFNRRAGIPMTIVCTGNEIAGMTDQQMTDSVLEGLTPTLEMAEDADVTLILEPLNTRYDHEGYWLRSSDRGAEICRRLDSSRMRLLYDIYHMQLMEGDLINHIRQCADVIGHFHAAGVPGRHEPYLGEIDYPEVIRAIEAVGYQGVFGLEYRPTIDHSESLRRTLEYLRSI